MGNLGVPFLFCLFNRTNKQKSRVQTRHGCPRHPTPQRCETVAGFCGRPRNTENNAMSSLKRGEPFPTEAFAVMIYSRRRRLVVPLSLFFFFSVLEAFIQTRLAKSTLQGCADILRLWMLIWIPCFFYGICVRSCLRLFFGRARLLAKCDTDGYVPALGFPARPAVMWRSGLYKRRPPGSPHRALFRLALYGVIGAFTRVCMRCGPDTCGGEGRVVDGFKFIGPPPFIHLAYLSHPLPESGIGFLPVLLFAREVERKPWGRVSTGY